MGTSIVLIFSCSVSSKSEKKEDIFICNAWKHILVKGLEFQLSGGTKEGRKGGKERERERKVQGRKEGREGERER